VSALLVPPGRVPQAQNPGVALRTITAETYRTFLASPAGAALGAGFLQCPSWADVKEGWRAQLLGWGPDPAEGRLTGVALVLLRQFPGTRKYFAYLPEGPVADWNDPGIDAWLGPLLEHLRSAGAFAVRIGPSPAYRRWDAALLKPLSGPGRRLGDVLASEVDPRGTAVAERLRARGWRRCGGDGTGADGDAHLLNLVIVALNAALCAGWVVTGLVLSRRLAVARPLRSSAAGAHARLLLAAVPATALGHFAVLGAARAGALPAATAGAATIVLTFALLTRPLRLTELNALLAGIRRTGTRIRTRT